MRGRACSVWWLAGSLPWSPPRISEPPPSPHRAEPARGHAPDPRAAASRGARKSPITGRVNAAGRVSAVGTGYLAHQPRTATHPFTAHLSGDREGKLYGYQLPYSLEQLADRSRCSPDPLIGTVHPRFLKERKELDRARSIASLTRSFTRSWVTHHPRCDRVCSCAAIGGQIAHLPTYRRAATAVNPGAGRPLAVTSADLPRLPQFTGAAARVSRAWAPSLPVPPKSPAPWARPSSLSCVGCSRRRGADRLT